jgi:hypothetical protein
MMIAPRMAVATSLEHLFARPMWPLQSPIAMEQQNITYLPNRFTSCDLTNNSLFKASTLTNSGLPLGRHDFLNLKGTSKETIDDSKPL